MGDEKLSSQGPEPAPTPELIGLRAFYRYSPSHLYGDIYPSSGVTPDSVL
ncbi:MAG: hypothetical protein JRJ03_11070 [Deltaproteobacteria bacterium]|nr:hypothetical protein [Deltaproteobacteria bacterium]